MKEKLEAAKAYPGTRWVLHPEYTAHRAKDAYLTKPKPEPRFIEINGHKVPEPMSEVPEKGTKYYIIDIYSESLVKQYSWADDASDSRWFERGLIHATREAAYAHAKALLSFTEVNHKEY